MIIVFCFWIDVHFRMTENYNDSRFVDIFFLRITQVKSNIIFAKIFTWILMLDAGCWVLGYIDDGLAIIFNVKACSFTFAIWMKSNCDAVDNMPNVKLEFVFTKPILR